MRRLLLLDDEINVLHALQRTLHQCHFATELRIETFTEPTQALVRAVEVDFDLVISDYHMPHMDGIEFLRRLRQLQPDAVRLILSASTDFDTVRRAINEVEILRFIPKPWQLSDLQEVILLGLARRDHSDAVKLKLGELTPRQLAERRLEADEPGITKVNWGEDGSVGLD
jgi:two-component system probable response regulator PhcQ